MILKSKYLLMIEKFLKKNLSDFRYRQQRQNCRIKNSENTANKICDKMYCGIPVIN